MAEWRSRGYVADSDEEEESQTSLYTVDVSSKKAHLDSNDTEIANPPKPSGSPVCRNDGENENVFFEVEVEGSTGAGFGKEEENAVLPDVHDGLTGTQMESGEGDGNVDGPLSLQNYGDVDELQEGHYQAAPVGQLEAELLHGTSELVGAARPTAPPHSWRPLPTYSSTSSPLSEVHEAPHDVSLTIDEKSSLRGDPSSTDDAESRNIGLPPPLALPDATVKTTARSDRASRTLRHRNPIQLHPYAIESEKYKQTLQARGVKPLRIAQIEVEAADTRKEESQNMDYYAEDSQEVGRISDQDSLGSSSPLRSQVSAADPVSNAKDMFVFGDDDELPDMKTLLQNTLHTYAGNRYKRRKIASASFRMPPGMSRAIQRPIAGVSSDNLNVDDDVMFDAPPSPIQSGSQTSVNIRPNLPPSRSVRKTLKVALPTPVTSSEPKRRQDIALSEDGSCDAPSYNRSRPFIFSDASESEEISGEDSFHQLQRVQRTIRGVLPASWLKLDIKTRPKKPHEQKKPYQSLSPERTLMQRGVARPVTVVADKDSDRSAAYNGAVVSSDDEGSVSDGDDLQQRLIREPQTHFIHNDDEGFFGDRWEEAAEMDRVDAMLPSVGRSEHQPKNPPPPRSLRRRSPRSNPIQTL